MISFSINFSIQSRSHHIELAASSISVFVSNFRFCQRSFFLQRASVTVFVDNSYTSSAFAWLVLSIVSAVTVFAVFHSSIDFVIFFNTFKMSLQSLFSRFCWFRFRRQTFVSFDLKIQSIEIFAFFISRLST